MSLLQPAQKWNESINKELKLCPCCKGSANYNITVIDNSVRCLSCGLNIVRPNDKEGKPIKYCESHTAWNIR